MVAKQRAAKVPCAHDHGAGGIIVAQEPFQIRNQAVGIIAHLRPAAGADERKVLSDLHIAKPQRFGDGRRRNVGRARTGHRFQKVKVLGQALQRLLGNGLHAHGFTPPCL